MISNRRKAQILVIASFSFLSVLWSGRIDYLHYEYSNIDLAKYRAMALSAPSINLDVQRPYVYRILAPWIVGVIPMDIDSTFYLLNSVALILLSVALFYFLLFHQLDEKISLFVTLLFIMNRYFFSFLAFDYFQLSDTLSYWLIILSFLSIARREFILFGIFLLLGVLTREVALLIIPVAYFYFYEKEFMEQDYLNLTLSLLPSVLVFVLVRILLPTHGEETLFSQLLTGITKFEFSSLIKKIFISITPFAFIPIIYPRELYRFFIKYKYLFVLFAVTFFSTFWGFDYERLMSPAAPVFYLFLGEILVKITAGERYSLKRALFFVPLFAISFFAMFYHLWGLVQLPDREVTIIVTVVLNVLMGLQFLAFKYFSETKIVDRNIN